MFAKSYLSRLRNGLFEGPANANPQALPEVHDSPNGKLDQRNFYKAIPAPVRNMIFDPDQAQGEDRFRDEITASRQWCYPVAWRGAGVGLSSVRWVLSVGKL